MWRTAGHRDTAGGRRSHRCLRVLSAERPHLLGRAPDLHSIPAACGQQLGAFEVRKGVFFRKRVLLRTGEGHLRLQGTLPQLSVTMVLPLGATTAVAACRHYRSDQYADQPTGRH